MDKKTAQNLIEDTFNDSFSEERFTIFAKNLLNDIEPKNNFYTGNLIWDDYKEHINTYKRIGKYIDPEGDALDVLIVEVKSVSKLERARTVLRNFVIKHLSKFEKDYALVAFYSKEDEGADWRFSFIKLEYRSELDGEKGKVKTKKEFTPAKRYSFLVGKYEKAHTAKNQLLPLLQNIANNPTIGELEAAFSIEKVTDEFFSQYKDLYVKLYEHFEKDSQVKAAIDKAGIDNTRFTKKLLGQIVFLYFLQKKGWLGVAQNERWGKGKKRFVQELNEQAQAEGVNFFKDKLQYLFYEALAKERDNVNSYYKPFNCRIPFLNGGLFEADYDWRNANITIPSALFRNEEKNKAGDVGTGVLDVFDRYNFTIKEDEPLDKEVAVDPEMLGKVFENMLDITERKSKGAFYTPREIVHYMCQESLIHYLDNALEGKVKKQDIETYIREGLLALENDERVAAKGETKTYKYQLPESIRKHADLIDKKLSDIRICDPAIGSGAFPVGLLHELVNAMLVLKPHLGYEYLTKKRINFGFEENGRTLSIAEVSESRYIYRLKRHIIQESIYGVDIDASAIDIARLRLWLSLVVDEDDLDTIETLPNLDYKIVCGNSLISRYSLEIPLNDVFKDVNKKIRNKDFENLKIKELIGNEEVNAKFYKKIVNDFLVESSHDKKDAFRALIKEIKNAFKNALNQQEKDAIATVRGEVDNLVAFDIFGKQIGSKEAITKAKEKLQKLEDDKIKTLEGDFYKNSIEWRFEFPNLLNDNGDFMGFDVVIGNPPYGASLQKKEKDLLRTQYVDLEFKIDSYEVFTLSANRLTRNGGVTSFIIPSNLMDNFFTKKIRKNLLEKRLLEIIELDDKVFIGAVVHSMIITWQNITSSNYSIKCKIGSIDNDNLFWGNDSFFLNEENFTFSLRKVVFKELIDKIYFDSLRLENILKIKDGIDTGNNNQYVSDTEISGWKRLIGGADVNRWKIANWRYVNYGKHLANPRDPELFENDKIVIRETGDKIIATIDLEGFYALSTLYSGRVIDDRFSLKSILGLLHSELIHFLMVLIAFGRTKGAFTKTRIYHYYSLPVKFSLIENSIIIDKIVDYMRFIDKEKHSQIIYDFFNSLLNSIFYCLFFPSEIKSAGKEILKHLGDLKPITDEMSEEEKLAIIQSEFERLYDPNHPVRFAIETLDSVEEVRIIKEALK